MMLTPLLSIAQEQADYTRIKNKITLGFQTDNTVLFPLFASPKNKEAAYRNRNTKSFLVRIPVTEHIKIESGINTTLLNSFSNNSNNNKSGNTRRYDISIPASVQYHFMKKSRIRPFVGIGAMYNLDLFNKNNESKSDYNTTTDEPGLKYINIVFTQGIIFEVNTKIHITQSFHFIPNSNLKTLGLSLGVEFTLP